MVLTIVFGGAFMAIWYVVFTNAKDRFKVINEYRVHTDLRGILDAQGVDTKRSEKPAFKVYFLLAFYLFMLFVLTIAVGICLLLVIVDILTFFSSL